MSNPDSPFAWLPSRMFSFTRPPAERRSARRASSRTRHALQPGLMPLESRELLTHYRYGNLTWEPVTGSSNTIDFHFQFAARLASSSVGSSIKPGDIITDTTGDTPFDYGDGSPTVNPVQFRVLSVNTVGDYFVSEAVHDAGGGNFQEGLIHTYAAPGNYTAFSASGARISTLQNNADGNYRTETIVNVGSTNLPPVSSLSPIVQVADNTTATFQVPATDPNGDPLTYRLATSAEASGGSGYTQPPGLTISPTGLITWDIHNGVVNTSPGDLWTSQVVVEDHDTSGNVKSKIPLDFILEVVTSVTAPPEFDVVPSAPIDMQSGQPFSFVVQASDPDLTTTVNVQALNPPTGMTFATEPPAPGSRSNAAAIRASFTPTAAQAAQSFVITFQATNNLGLSAQSSVTLRPGPALPDRPPVFDSLPVSPISVYAGSTLQFVVQASDPDAGDTVTLTLSATPAGVTVAGARAAAGSRANAVAKALTVATDPKLVGQTVTLDFVADDGRGGEAQASVQVHVVPAPVGTPTGYPLSGTLDPASDSGMSHTDAITNVTKPRFLGTASPGSTVQLFVTPAGQTQSTSIGQVVAAADGSWVLTANHSLSDGAYQVSATATATDGTVAPAVLLPDSRRGIGPLTIDTVAPRITKLVICPSTSRILVTFADDRSGLDPTTVTESNNFRLVTSSMQPIPLYRITSASTVSPAGSNAPDTMALATNFGGRSCGGRTLLFTVVSGGVSDVAGNALDGEFRSHLPTGNNIPGGNFQIRIVTNGRQVLSLQPVPDPIKHVQAVKKPASVPAARATSVGPRGSAVRQQLVATKNGSANTRRLS
jgi:hypothetical protein